MAYAKHDHEYGPVVEEDEEGNVTEWSACRICGKEEA